MKQERLLELDALRGIAALSVMFFHYFFRYGTNYGHSIPFQWTYYGKYGVQLFFIISGFVIYWTLSKVENPIDFIISRFSRIYPSYWAAVIVTFSVIHIFGLPNREVDYITALINLTMTQEFLGITHVDSVYWTLTTEITFYFWIFVLFLCKQFKNAELWMAPIVLLAILKHLHKINTSSVIDEIFILEYMPFFIMGICLFKIKNNNEAYYTWLLLITILLATSIIFSWTEFWIFLFFSLVFIAIIFDKSIVLKNKYLCFLGGISYPLYLVHQNIGYVIINNFYLYHLSPWLGIVIAALISFLTAILINMYIEKPMLKNIRIFFQRYIKLKN